MGKVFAIILSTLLAYYFYGQEYIKNYAFLVLIGIIPMLLLIVMFYGTRILTDEYFTMSVRDTITNVLIAQAPIFLLLQFVMQLPVNESASVPLILLHSVVRLICADLVMYFFHALMHTRFLYPIHKMHHQYVMGKMSPIAGIAGDIFEFVITAYVVSLPYPYILFNDLVLYDIPIVALLMNGIGIITHHTEDTKFMENSIINYPRFHQMHHRHGRKNYNFAFFFTYTDHLFGTYRDPGDFHGNKLD